MRGRTDLATKRMSSISLSRSARAVASDRTGLYMLKKHSGTRNENDCASIAKKVCVSKGSVRFSFRDTHTGEKKKVGSEMERRTPKVDVEVLQAT